MDTNYDVVIAGGGIAGSYAARELSKSRLKVLLIDSAQTLGSTAWTPAITIERFSLPKEGINAVFNEVILGTLKKEKKWTSENTIGYVLDYKRMSSLILEQAKAYGCTVFTESTVNSLIKKNDEIVGVNTSKGDFYSKYIIDATGAAGILVSEVGLRKRVPAPPSVGIELEVYDEHQFLVKYKNSISMFFDTKIFPCGYGWVSTNGQDKYKIGICEYENSSSKRLTNLETRLEAFMQLLLKDKKVEILEKHGGSIYVGPKFKLKNIFYKNLLGIGDTIGSINPFLGEGIRHALYSSDFAVSAIIENYKNKEKLNNYEKAWEKYIGFRWELYKFFGMALYEKNTSTTQNFYDQFVTFFENISLNDMLQFGQEFNITPVLKKFPKNIGLFIGLIKTRFFNFG